MKKILTISLFFILVCALGFTTKYALQYMHWSTKALGYPGLYQQKEAHTFLPADSNLLNAKWELLATDTKDDGDILNWPDAKELHVHKGADTIWLAYSLYNNLDINEPMVSIAIEEENGKDWYGSVDMKYKRMISVGYFRNGDKYHGYNFFSEDKGVCDFKYSLSKNTLFIGLPRGKILGLRGSRFIASVGQKSYWNDDYETILEFDKLLAEEDSMDTQKVAL